MEKIEQRVVQTKKFSYRASMTEDGRSKNFNSNGLEEFSKKNELLTEELRRLIGVEGSYLVCYILQ